eukprot:gene12163-12301_t
MHNYMYDPKLNTWNLDPEEHPGRLNPQHRCLDNGAWPYQTCSLKFLAGEVNVTSPPLQPEEASIGWVSGVIQKIVAPPPTPEEWYTDPDPVEQALIDGFYDEGGFSENQVLEPRQSDRPAGSVVHHAICNPATISAIRVSEMA